MKLWHLLVLLAMLVVAALIVATLWGWMTTPFYLLGVLVILLCLFLLSQAVRIVASAKSYREFMNMNLRIAEFYTAIDPQQRDQAKQKDEEEKLP
jgi:ABC-type multidrug transport system fused ATPase/permease subunit